jgi:hypothetical protein
MYPLAPDATISLHRLQYNFMTQNRRHFSSVSSIIIFDIKNMCPDVLYHGEWIDKDYLYNYLNSPEGQRKEQELEALEAQEKAEERKRKKQQQIQKKPYENISEIPEEYLPDEYKELRKKHGENLIIDDDYGRRVIAYGNKMRLIKQEHAEWEKQQQEWLQAQEQKEKQRKEREEQERKQRAEAKKRLPEEQLQMVLNGTYGRWSSCGCKKYPELGHNRFCTSALVEDIEPGLSLLKQEYSIGKIIRLNEQTHKRLAEFAISDETYPDLINRLLDTATAEAPRRKQH